MTRWRIVVYTLLVAMSLLLLGMNNTPQVQDVRRGINYALSPVQQVLAGAARSVANALSAVGEIDQLRRQNESYQAEIDRLSQRLAQLEVVAAENERLARLLGRKAVLRYRTVSAFVVSRPPSQVERVISLDRGREAGIAVNDPVLSDGGALVGKIAEVGDGYSTVRLLSDSRSVVIGRDTQTRALGEIYGRLTGPLEMRNIQKTDRISVGNAIMTAGLDYASVESDFPRGLVIGTIVDVTDNPADLVKSALVQPSADLEGLDAVLVILDFTRPRRPGGTPEPPAFLAPDASAEPDATQKPPRPARTQRPGR
jgi:rod shape-determining protein MreC